MDLEAQKGIIKKRIIRKSPFSVGYYNFQPSILTDNYPAKLPMDLAEELVLQYSDPGDLILDPFIGSGTTLRAAVKHGRRGIGLDINPDAIDLCKQYPELQTCKIELADSRKMTIPDDSIDVIITSSPYGTLIAGKKLAYSDDPRDLSNAKNYNDFLLGLLDILEECFRVLKPGRPVCFVAKDRNKRILQPLASYILVFGGMPKDETFTINGVLRHGVGFWPWSHRVFPTIPYMIWTFGAENKRKAIPQHEELAVLVKPDGELPEEEEPKEVERVKYDVLDNIFLAEKMRSGY